MTFPFPIIPPSSTALTISTIRTDTLNADGSTWTNYNFRIVFEAAGLTAPGGTLTQIRFTLQPASGVAFAWDAMYVAHKAAAGDAWDYAASPVQLLVAGAGTGTLAAGSTTVTDWATFGWDQTSGVTFAIHQANSASNSPRILDGATNVATYVKLGASDIHTANETGYAAAGQELQLVSKIEVR